MAASLRDTEEGSFYKCAHLTDTRAYGAKMKKLQQAILIHQVLCGVLWLSWHSVDIEIPELQNVSFSRIRKALEEFYIYSV